MITCCCDSCDSQLKATTLLRIALLQRVPAWGPAGGQLLSGPCTPRCVSRVCRKPAGTRANSRDMASKFSKSFRSHEGNNSIAKVRVCMGVMRTLSRSTCSAKPQLQHLDSQYGGCSVNAWHPHSMSDACRHAPTKKNKPKNAVKVQSGPILNTIQQRLQV